MVWGSVRRQSTGVERAVRRVHSEGRMFRAGGHPRHGLPKQNLRERSMWGLGREVSMQAAGWAYCGQGGAIGDTWVWGRDAAELPTSTESMGLRAIV